VAEFFYSDKEGVINEDLCEEAQLDNFQLLRYGKGKPLFGWHISDLKIYDKPKELSEFGLNRAPQSWCYVEMIE